MAALQQARFSIYDLQGFRRTQESLDQLLIRKDYRLSEPTLQEKLTQPNKTLQNRKEELLIKACQELDLPSIIFEFKSIDLVNDKIAIQAIARATLQEQKNLLDLMLAVRVNRKIADLLEKEALQIFAYNELLKEHQLAMAAILAQERSEAFFRNQNELTESKMQLEAQLFALRQNIHKESMTKLNDLFNQVDKLAKQYNDIQVMRENNMIRHDENIDHIIDDCEIEGQKVFNKEDKKHIHTLLEQKKEVKNEIEAVDREINLHKQIVIDAKVELEENKAEQAMILHEIAEIKHQTTPEEKKLIEDCIDLESEDVASHIEQDLCEDKLEQLHKEKERCEASASNAKEDSNKTEIMKKIDKLSIEELRLQEKVAALKEQQAQIAEKRKAMMGKFLKSNNVATASYKMARYQVLKMEEKELNERIQRAESQIENLTTKRQALHNKLAGIMISLDQTFEKTTNWVKNIFSKKKPREPQAEAAATAKIAAVKKAIEDESETSREEDNAYAEQLDETKQQMQHLALQADAVAGVGAGCNAQIGSIAPHSQHNETLSGYQSQEDDARARIHAAVAAALGASAGVKLQASAG